MKDESVTVDELLEETKTEPKKKPVKKPMASPIERKLKKRVDELEDALKEIRDLHNGNQKNDFRNRVRVIQEVNLKD